MEQPLVPNKLRGSISNKRVKRGRDGERIDKPAGFEALKGEVESPMHRTEENTMRETCAQRWKRRKELAVMSKLCCVKQLILILHYLRLPQSQLSTPLRLYNLINFNKNCGNNLCQTVYFVPYPTTTIIWQNNLYRMGTKSKRKVSTRS